VEDLKELRILVNELKNADDTWIKRSIYISLVEVMDRLEKELYMYRDLNLERDLMS